MALTSVAVGRREARIQRLMARFVGGGFIAYLLVSIGEFATTAVFVAPWFTPVGAIIAFTPGIVLFAYSFRDRLDQRLLAAIALSTTIGYLIASGLWFLAWDGVSRDLDRVSWLMSFGGLPSLATVLVRPFPVGAASLVVCISVSTVSTGLGRDGELGWGTATQTLWGIAYSSVYLIAAAMVRRTGRTLDQTREAALAAASATAATAARDIERARFDALVHDHVIATLLAAEPGTVDCRLAAQARRALDTLDDLAQSPEITDLSRDDAAARLRVTVASVDDAVAVRITDLPADGEVRYPVEVVAAISEALAEAVRNSVRHGGPEAQSAVFVELGADHIRAGAVDDGAGFDPAAVPPERLGIEVSIRLRMASVAGGGARVRSEPGDGTTVGVWWQRPAEVWE
ncbi:ATP-binding protein [Gordonia sp. NB41Y]|uniref:sensor histidine kinase n=1 Tax=Gordonia sp. NB41Y TaxID=875808 RepID=UPI0006B1879D|nr:ATP-binding protein [Gordonia sp. NB41Y]KOY49323.1 hypothetical protein ISGA_10935 [Gordonia sp. NB41Y]WLP89705.1 ATP-binding protein [Gordonia sp. NB41Y]